jgi:hypothetical protein
MKTAYSEKAIEREAVERKAIESTTQNEHLMCFTLLYIGWHQSEQRQDISRSQKVAKNQYRHLLPSKGQFAIKTAGW